MSGTQGIHWVLLGASMSNDNSEKGSATTMDWLENSKMRFEVLKNEGLSFTEMKQANLAEMTAKDEWNIQ